MKKTLLIAVLTLAYSIIAFINLGSSKVPENYWRPDNVGEHVIADLGSSSDIKKVYYYPGLGGGLYTIAFSEDAETWKLEQDINVDSMYKWGVISTDVKSRYIKITAQKPGGMLNEVGFFGMDEEKPLTVKKVSLDNANPSYEKSGKAAFDEQDTLVYRPSYLQEMYFDEVYHARTAFEHINRIEPYEWTHPPLGKLLISIGILIFGMNPFGWRVVGTLFGIVMIPAMYLLGKKFFKRTEYAFIAAFLMAFDFMHFTQTRLSTVDVYVVFFTICMYYFMYKYLKADFYSNSLKKFLIPLGLSGLFFGLGASTKWNCIYGGAGLAVILFKDLYDKYREYKAALLAMKSGSDIEVKNTEIIKYFPKNVWKLILWCMLFFIVVPAVIYLLSYIPYMLVAGAEHGIKDILNLQVRMYDYHSKLTDTHPYASHWWEWPIIIKPMWYYTGDAYIPSDKVSSIVAMGNPAVWWIGAVSFIITLFIGIKKKDRNVFFIVVAAMAQYLPWILVTRVAFIYHYFPVVPFLIICIVYVIRYLTEHHPKLKYGVYFYLGVVAALFIMFYPIISGLIVSKDYVSMFLRWFNQWYFF